MVQIMVGGLNLLVVSLEVLFMMLDSFIYNVSAQGAFAAKCYCHPFSA